MSKKVKNKFVQTKMGQKGGTKIKLQIDLSDFVRFCQICQIFRFRFVRLVRFANFRDKKNGRRTDKRTNRPTDGQTDPLIEMRGRI